MSTNCASRPGGCVSGELALNLFGVANLTNGFARPVRQPNAWVAAFEDEQPCLKLTWSKPQKISRVELMFDSDYDHPMESVSGGGSWRGVLATARLNFCDTARTPVSRWSLK